MSHDCGCRLDFVNECGEVVGIHFMPQEKLRRYYQGAIIYFDRNDKSGQVQATIAKITRPRKVKSGCGSYHNAEFVVTVRDIRPAPNKTKVPEAGGKPSAKNVITLAF